MGPSFTNTTTSAGRACRQATDHWYLAMVIWREARGESAQGRAAVGWSVLNRVQKPCWWGDSIETVVTKAWQYSSMTDPRDRQLARAWPHSSEQAWQECFEIARQLIAGEVLDNPVPCADSYHDISIAPPKWTEKARKVGQIGRLVFYDVDRDHEQASRA
jgi:cell wall hydrolase